MHGFLDLLVVGFVWRSERPRGVFQPGSRCPAWIRFSNGASDPNRPDIAGDARGMAIKRMGCLGRSSSPPSRAQGISS